MQEIIKRVPIPVGGLALGVVSLGNLLSPLNEMIGLVCAIISMFLIGMLLTKTMVFPKMIKKDLENPILATVSAATAMAIMQLSANIANVSIGLGVCIWIAAVSMHLSLIAWFSRRLVRDFRLNDVFPTYFVCYVGIIVASVTSPAFGLEAFGRILFMAGFACYVPLLAVISIRCARHSLPDAAKPLMCIYSAPASLSLVGYLAVFPDPNPYLVGGFLVFAQAFFVFALTKVPAMIAGGFYPSFAAMTFPFVITATALVQGLGFFGGASTLLSTVLGVVAGVEILFAASMVVFVLARYAVFLLAPVFEARKADTAVIADKYERMPD